MKRLTVLTRSPLLTSVLPFFGSDNAFDKTAKDHKSMLLDDEMGWDRVKKIFRLKYIFYCPNYKACVFM